MKNAFPKETQASNFYLRMKNPFNENYNHKLFLRVTVNLSCGPIIMHHENRRNCMNI